MSDPVDRQVAIDALKDRYYKYGRFAKLEELVWTIKKLPSAQPEIIRCEDCTWWRDEDCTNPVGMFLPDEDDFCSCATRRTDESNV